MAIGINKVNDIVNLIITVNIPLNLASDKPPSEGDCKDFLVSPPSFSGNFDPIIEA